MALLWIIIYDEVLDAPEEVCSLMELFLDREDRIEDVYRDPFFSISYSWRTHLTDRSLTWRPSASSRGISSSTDVL